MRHLAKLLLWEDSGHFVAQCSSGLSEDAERSLLSAERLPVIYLTLDGGSFRVQMKVMGKSYVLGSQKERLKIHAWSNICISIDGISGHLKAVVDGYSLESLSLNELKTREGINLANRLVLGVTWIDRDRVYQSESLAYHAILSQSRMEEATELEVLPLLGTPQIGPKQER